MRWTGLRSLAEAPAIYWAFGLWIPVIASILVARAGALVKAFPDLARLDYPRAIAAAVLFAVAGTIWGIFATLCRIVPDRTIREHKSLEEYLERRQKAYLDPDEWPAVYTEIVVRWHHDDRIGPLFAVVLTFLLATMLALVLFGAYHLVRAALPLLFVW